MSHTPAVDNPDNDGRTIDEISLKNYVRETERSTKMVDLMFLQSNKYGENLQVILP